MDALFAYVLGLADDALVLGHRLSEWSGRGPTLEEDIALSNLGLDLIGQARLFYQYAGKLEGRGRDEDALAYFRDHHEFKNVLLVEQPNGDFAATMVRHLVYSAFAHPFMAALAGSKDEVLAGVGAKAEKEMAYHLHHAAEWAIRLGDGTQESARRARDAVDEFFIYADELFEMDAGERDLVALGIAPNRAALRPAYQQTIDMVLAEAGLCAPKVAYGQRGGRAGVHTEHLGKMLAEMQVLARAHPGAVW